MDYRLLDRRILPDIEMRYQIDPGKLNESMETTPSVFKKNDVQAMALTTWPVLRRTFLRRS